MKHFNIPAIIISAAALSACQGEEAEISPSLEVSGAEIIVSPVAGRPAAAYFTLEAQGKDAVLTGVDVSGAKRTMLHETITEDGVSRMEGAESFTAKAGEELVFERGGKHVMVFGLDGAEAGQNITMTLRFEDGRTLNVEAETGVIGAAAADQSDKGE